MSNYILTADGKLYHCDVGESELYHYGVPGMKWGRRKADKYEAKAQKYLNRGRMKKFNKYQSKADAINTKLNSKFEKFASKKYAKAGTLKGYGEYERSRGDAAYKKHDSAATAMEKTANQYEKSGKFMRAEALRKAASATRSRGANIRNAQYAAADDYVKSAERMIQKVSDYASKNRVSMGKNKINSIMKKSIQEGLNQSKQYEEFDRQSRIQERGGSGALKAYKFVTGR